SDRGGVVQRSVDQGRARSARVPSTRVHHLGHGLTPVDRSMTTGRLSRFFQRLLWPRAPRSLDGCTVVSHEWLSTLAGSDRVAAEIAEAVDADYVFTLTADPGLVEHLGIKAPVIDCRLGPHVAQARRWQLLLPVMPVIWRSLDVRSASTVVT